MLSRRDQVVTSIVVVKAALINKNGEILLVQRSVTDRSDPTEWEFPGGKLENGELVEEVLVREINEEVGIKLNRSLDQLAHVSSRLVTDNSDYLGLTVVTITYIIRLKAQPKVILSDEHTDHRWISLDKAMKLNLREATKKVLKNSNFFGNIFS